MNSLKPQYNVFFDFDNTITAIDVLDDIIWRFSINKDWVEFERKWVKGEIGSKECLKGQLNSVRITESILMHYLSKVRLDPFFKKLLFSLRKKGIEPIIVSDNFSVLIEAILKARGVTGLKIYANNLKLDKDRLLPSFPHFNRFHRRCANCKKKHVLKHFDRDRINVYIGDGFSDACAAQKADLIFAKDNLKAICRKRKIPFVPFRNLGEVAKHMKL